MEARMAGTPGTASSGGNHGATTGDPAALVGAAVAAAIAIFVEPGKYTVGTTALGLTLLLLLHVYDRENSIARPQLFAFGAVWALCMLLTLGVIIEWTCPEFLCKTPGRIERVEAYNREFFLPIQDDSRIPDEVMFGLWLSLTVIGSAVARWQRRKRLTKTIQAQQSAEAPATTPKAPPGW
jgi:hypothetical protein